MSYSNLQDWVKNNVTTMETECDIRACKENYIYGLIKMKGKLRLVCKHHYNKYYRYVQGIIGICRICKQIKLNVFEGKCHNCLWL